MTAPVRRSVVLATSHLAVLAPVAQAVESAGFDRIWCTESLGSDALVRAQHLIHATTRLPVATGITYAFTRSPVATAVAAADLTALSRGRFALGLGAGTRGVRRRYGVAGFDHPAPRMAEYAHVVRAALAAVDGMRYQGDFYRVEAPGLALAGPAAGCQVYGAAVQPVMVRAMAASCDGVALHSLAVQGPVWARHTLPSLQAGAARSGRWPRVAAWTIVSVHEDERQARDQARRQLAFYFSTPTYGAMAVGTAWEQDVAALARAARAGGDLAGLTQMVTDVMIDRLTVSGSPAEVRHRLDEFESRLGGEGVDEVVLQIVQAPSADQTLEAALALVDTCRPPAATGAPR